MFLQQFPRVKLAALPTPLEMAPRLSRELGIDLYFKRDDNTGLAIGGNKARKLEYLVGQALDNGCDTLVTTGGPQSNHCRMTAAAAAKLGLHCHLVLTSNEISARQGNLLLDELLGAKLHFIGPDSGGLADKAMQQLSKELTEKGAKPYVIPLGGSNSTGAVGYVRAIHELLQQAEAIGASFDYILHASGSAGTQAGLLAGTTFFSLPTRVLGMSVSRPRERLSREVLELCNLTLEGVASAKRVQAEDVQVYDEYVGPGYGLPTELSKEAISMFARLEGVLIDPVYTAKAAAGLIDLCRKDFFHREAKVLFWHTGGSPALFADQVLHWGEN